MNALKLGRTVLLFSCGFFTAITLAQCHNTSLDAGDAGSSLRPGSIPTAAQDEGQDRTVLLNLVLRKSGAVRDVKVLKGPTEMREPAIQAARHRKYKDALHAWPFSNEIMVEVTFPKVGDGGPEIRQALPAGVPGCVHAPSRVRVSSGVMQSYLLKRVDPVYPAGVEKVGVLVLWLNIDKEGNVSSVDKVSGADALAPAAIDAVKKWKYRPYELNGDSVEVQTTVELNSPN